jgi:predicted dehydrogenase
MLMVGHVLEYHPAIVKLHKLIHADELGDVHYISSNRLNLGKVRRKWLALRGSRTGKIALPGLARR